MFYTCWDTESVWYKNNSTSDVILHDFFKKLYRLKVVIALNVIYITFVPLKFAKPQVKVYPVNPPICPPNPNLKKSIRIRSEQSDNLVMLGKFKSLSLFISLEIDSLCGL